MNDDDDKKPLTIETIDDGIRMCQEINDLLSQNIWDSTKVNHFGVWANDHMEAALYMLRAVWNCTEQDAERSIIGGKPLESFSAVRRVLREEVFGISR